MGKQEPLEPVIPLAARVAWRVWVYLTWPGQVRQMKRAGFRRTGWMTWETGLPPVRLKRGQDICPEPDPPMGDLPGPDSEDLTRFDLIRHHPYLDEPVKLACFFCPGETYNPDGICGKCKKEGRSYDPLPRPGR